jgi:hypothetical protein
VAWIVKLVKIGAGGEEEVTDILKIERPGDLDAAGLGLTSAEASLLLAGMQREIMTAQAKADGVQSPEMPRPKRARPARARPGTSVARKPSHSTSPPEDEEGSVWDDLFSSTGRSALGASPVTEAPASVAPSKRTRTPKVRTPAPKAMK